MPLEQRPTNEAGWNTLSATFAQAATQNVIQQFAKHGLLGLSDEGTAVIYGIMFNIARHAFSAAAVFQREGIDISPAILPNQSKSTTPPSPL